MDFVPSGIYLGDARDLADHIEPASVSLSVWSPPYHVGKDYERDMSFFDWKYLLRRAIVAHSAILKPGGFLAINIADILCFQDPEMPRIQADNVSRRARNDITKEQIVATWDVNPTFTRQQIADVLGCSEQTVHRRMNGNNIRGGKYGTQTRVKIAGGMLEEFAAEAGLYLYDRRVWVKDAAWENSRWHTVSYRAVDEFEYVYVFWKPGITLVNKDKLSRDEWTTWGSRAVWQIPSVRANDDHEAKFPVELPRRIIRLFSEPGDVVLDCFVGSGTSAIAAVHQQRQFIGVDNSEKYVALARRTFDAAIHNVVLNLEIDCGPDLMPKEEAKGEPDQRQLLEA